jgi:hypothetical protein
LGLDWAFFLVCFTCKFAGDNDDVDVNRKGSSLVTVSPRVLLLRNTRVDGVPDIGLNET